MNEIRRRLLISGADSSWYTLIGAIRSDGVAYIDTKISNITNGYTKTVMQTYVPYENYTSNIDIAGVSNVNGHYSQIMFNYQTLCYHDRNSGNLSMQPAQLGAIYNNRPWYNRYAEVIWYCGGIYQMEFGAYENRIIHKDLQTGISYLSNVEATSTNNDSCGNRTFPIFAHYATNTLIKRYSNKYTMHYFALYTGSGRSTYGLKFEGYPCKLTRNITGEFAWDNKSHSSGELGFYDAVTGKFFGNAISSGTFIQENWI